jgi:hypothetical protein
MTRNLFIFLCFLALSPLSGIAGNIVHVYEFKSPILRANGEYSIIYFEGAKLLGQPGRASLPFIPVKLLLPPGEVASSISIRYEDPVILEGKHVLEPMQEIRPLSENENMEWIIDKDFYSSSSEYPASYTPGLQTHYYNGCGIALSAFTPVRYLPSQGKVTWYSKVVVEIQTETDRVAPENRHFFASEKKAGFLKDLVQNPGEVDRYFSERSFLTSEYEYLVITTNQYKVEFDTLKRFYEKRGIKTKVASTEFINAIMTGSDLQQKIRNYIIQQYDSNGIEYVMIGGDVQIVPYRGFYCHVLSGVDVYEDYGIPADLYYAALDGNWNTDGDNKWGEPNEDDLYPEIGVGRVTFGDTAELHNILHKSFLYQSDPVEGELTKPLLAGEALWSDPYTIGSDYLNLLVGYCTENGYNTHGIPPEHPRDTLYDNMNYNWSKATLISHINSGRPWVHHVGHANQGYVMKLYNADITNANFSQTNGIAHNYPVIYTHGCICGGFDYSDCIGERMIGIDNFAVAFVGNSRYGWFNQGTTDGPSQHLHREFMDALYYDSLYHIGMAHMKSKSETAPFVEITGEFEPGATRWCFYDNNVLGDPMMALWTGEPHVPEVSYPAMIPAGAGPVTVQLNSPIGACKDFTCALFRNDTLFGTARTGSNGSTTLYPDGEITEGAITLVVLGYNILPQYFTIQACNLWLGYSDDWSDPANWSSGEVPDNSSYIIIPQDPAGSKFPLLNSGAQRICKQLLVEPGAQFRLRKGETFSVVGD